MEDHSKARMVYASSSVLCPRPSTRYRVSIVIPFQVSSFGFYSLACSVLTSRHRQSASQSPHHRLRYRDSWSRIRWEPTCKVDPVCGRPTPSVLSDIHARSRSNRSADQSGGSRKVLCQLGRTQIRRVSPSPEAHLKTSPPLYVVYHTRTHSDPDADIME